MTVKKSNFEIYADIIPETQRDSWNEIFNVTPEMDFRLLLILTKGPRANWELCLMTNRPAHSISGSITRLAEKGLIIDSGQKSKNPKSNKGQIIWKIR